jgi:hypothetical protein
MIKLPIGNQTWQLTFRNLRKFAWIGAFSGTGYGLSSAPIDRTTFPFPGAIGAFRKMPTEAGVQHVYFESAGTDHDRQNL